MKSPFIVIFIVLTSALLCSFQLSAIETQPLKQKATPSRNNATSSNLNSIILGAGCFWGAEKRYAAIPGVVDAISGYADGSEITPTYSEITKKSNKFKLNNYAEVVKVTFNPKKVSLTTILQHYFEGHDPTQLNRQGNDIGTQYRSTILTNSDMQTQIATDILNQYQTQLTQNNFGKIVTKIKRETLFHPAEDYHQDYLEKNPNGYCPDHSTGVKFAVNHSSQNKSPLKNTVDNQFLMKGKQIVVIESKSYCPYCEKFKTNVSNAYKGTIPITYRLASQLNGLEIETKTGATPTILFLNNGKEVFGQKGYMSPKYFYKMLGMFKLGKSEAFNVAFNQGTDAKYCKQYEIFKNTPDGLFVDKLSGAPLFDTKDRFNSSSGWLSFTQPVKGSTYEIADNSHGLKRTEIRSKSSGIHLGHVFPDGPNGQSRYCINATVLEFRARY